MCQAGWTVYRSVRKEEDPFRQLQQIGSIAQQRYLSHERELHQATKDCQRLMPYYRKMMGHRRLLASSYLTGDWQDSNCLVCMVVNPMKRNSKDAAVAAKAETRVDLGALLNKDYKRACEKQCMLYDGGLCVHVIAGEQSRSEFFFGTCHR